MRSMVDLDRHLIELTGAGRPTVAILPQAPSRAQRAKTVALARNYWTRLGAKVRIAFPLVDPAAAEEAILEADVAVIPGGHPNKLVDGLAASPFTDLLIDRWLDGMAISGSSAGAMCLFEWRIKLYPPNPLRLLPGLGVLDGFVAAPHFDRLRARRWAHRGIGALEGLAVLGLDEATGMVGHSPYFEVFGSGRATVVTLEGTTSHSSGALLHVDLLAGSALRLRSDEQASAMSSAPSFVLEHRRPSHLHAHGPLGRD